MKIGVVIPVYNPPEIFKDVLNALFSQTIYIAQIVLIDSSPKDSIVNISKWCAHNQNIKLTYTKIKPEEFDHGRTRNLGVQMLEDCDTAIFITQDVVLESNCIENMIEFLVQNEIGAAYARQIPRYGCTEIERIEREFNYPANSKINNSYLQTIENVFFSNACSAVKLDVFWAVGGFPERVIFAEDMIFATSLLKAGYATGYCSEALARHSHPLNFKENLKRYFDMGVMHSLFKNELPLNTNSRRGLEFVKTGFAYLIKYKPSQLFRFFSSVLGKFLGYKLGLIHVLLPKKLIIKITNNKAYWTFHYEELC